MTEKLISAPLMVQEGIPGGSAVKEYSYDAQASGDTGSIPGWKDPLEEAWQPLQCSCLENPWTQRRLLRLQSIGWQRVRYNWSNWAHMQAPSNVPLSAYIDPITSYFHCCYSFQVLCRLWGSEPPVLRLLERGSHFLFLLQLNWTHFDFCTLDTRLQLL